jgi:DNA ligase (NAD+)
MSRGQAEDTIRELGGKVGSSVSKSTDFLVVGADAGTKLQKAEKLRVRTITEAEFQTLIEDGPAALEAAPDA